MLEVPGYYLWSLVTLDISACSTLLCALLSVRRWNPEWTMRTVTFVEIYANGISDPDPSSWSSEPFFVVSVCIDLYHHDFHGH